MAVLDRLLLLLGPIFNSIMMGGRVKLEDYWGEF